MHHFLSFVFVLNLICFKNYFQLSVAYNFKIIKKLQDQLIKTMKDYSLQKKYYPSQNLNGFEANQNNQYRFYTPHSNKNLNLNSSNSSINYSNQRSDEVINKNKTPFKQQVKPQFQNLSFQQKYFVSDYSKENYQNSNQKNMISNLRQQLNSLKSQVNKLIQKDPQSASKYQNSFTKKSETNNVKENSQGFAKLVIPPYKPNDQYCLRRQSQPVQSQFLVQKYRQSIHTTKPNQIMNKKTQNKVNLNRTDSLKQKQSLQQHNGFQKSFEHNQKKNQFFYSNKKDFQFNKQLIDSKKLLTNNNNIEQKKLIENQKKNPQCVNCAQNARQVLFLKEKIQKHSLPDHYLQQIQHQQSKMKKLIQIYEQKNYNLKNSYNDLQNKTKQQQQKNKQLREKNILVNQELQDAKRMIEQVRLSVGLKNSLLDKFQSEIDQLKNCKLNMSRQIQQLQSRQMLLVNKMNQFQKLKQRVTQLQNDERRLLKDAEYWKGQYQQTNIKLNLIRLQIKSLQRNKFGKQQELASLKDCYKSILQSQSKNTADLISIRQKQQNQILFERQKQIIVFKEQIKILNKTVQSLKSQIENHKTDFKKQSKNLCKQQREKIQKQVRQSFNQKNLQNEIISKDKLIHNLYKDLQHFQNQLKLNICLKNNYQLLINQLNQKELQRKAIQINLKFKFKQHDYQEVDF